MTEFNVNHDINVLAEEDIRLFVGKNAEYYLNKWKSPIKPKIFKKESWNIAAFFFGVFWLGYRKMYKTIAIIFACFLVIDILQILINIDINNAIGTSLQLILGCYGNKIYYNHTINKISTQNRY